MNMEKSRKINILINGKDYSSYLEENGWVFCNGGCCRDVYIKGSYVIKIPFNGKGLQANKSEHKLYRESLGKHKKYAPCRLLSNNCLIMRAVLDLFYYNEDEDEMEENNLIPSWAYDLNDGPQVGIDNKGSIFAYDYAEEDPEIQYGGNCYPSQNAV
jgi:hypothetical protein